mmetsp:Transcript_3173/g.5297  ORF Transcript_3173/g.5297 Transcript_3173/m.5297 type:complete len:100 (+) Transcript_3173:689-988(+)
MCESDKPADNWEEELRIRMNSLSEGGVKKTSSEIEQELFKKERKRQEDRMKVNLQKASNLFDYVWYLDMEPLMKVHFFEMVRNSEQILNICDNSRKNDF